MAYPKGYIKEAKSFIVDNSLFQRGLVIRCLCGYTGDCMDDWLHFRAAAIHNEHYSGKALGIEGLQPPVDAVRLYVCPRCGIVKCTVHDTGETFTLQRFPVDLGLEKLTNKKEKIKEKENVRQQRIEKIA